MRRRRPRASGVLLLLSVMLAAAATLAIRGHLARVEARAAEVGPSRPVVVAATYLRRGEVVGPGAIRVEHMPAEHVPPGALGSTGEVAGRLLGADLAAGEVVTRTRLAPAGGPVAALVPPGFRAFPVAADLPPGTVAPGDRVDVLAAFGDRPYAELLVSGAEVLRVVPGGLPEEVGGGETAFLLVTPTQARELARVRGVAALALAVAPPGGVP